MSGVKVALVTSGDPRRPDEVHMYAPPPVDPDKDFSAVLIAASLVGLAGLYLKIRAASWVGAFLTLCAYATVRKSQTDTKQLVFSAVFALMGLSTVYIVPALRHFFPPANNATQA